MMWSIVAMMTKSSALTTNSVATTSSCRQRRLLSWRCVLTIFAVSSCLVQWKTSISCVTSSANNVVNLQLLEQFTTSHSPLQHSINFFNLPKALHPVTFPQCCDNATHSWSSVCFTEQACLESSFYPFESARDMEYFQHWNPQNISEIKDHVLQCKTANNELQPPHDWCSMNYSYFTTGCSRYTMSGGSGPYDRLIVFPQHKLAVCGIPKSGFTQWLQFLRFVIGAKDYQSFPHQKSDISNFFVDRMRPNVSQYILQNWTNKAVLIRHPAERLLSAYLEKVGPSKRRSGASNVTFADFVHRISINGLSWYTDPHWRPQAWSCGLSELLPSFDYIGTLDNAAQHARAILEGVDLWENYGKHYRISPKNQRKGSMAGRWPPDPTKVPPTGFWQQDQDTYSHNKNSHNKMNQYYTPELLAKVKQLYWMDFRLWDAVKQAEQEGKVHGKDIAANLKPICAL